MKNKSVVFFVCMLMIVAVVVPTAGTGNQTVIRENKFIENQTSTEFVPGEFIVKLKKDITLSTSLLMVLNEKSQVTAVEKVFPNAEGTILDNIYLVHVPIWSDISSIIQEYKSCSEVIYAEPNAFGHLCWIPNDANFSRQWYLHNTGQVLLNRNGTDYFGTPDADIDAPEAWEIETGSPDVVIAIIDSGVDYTHPDLAANIWNNIDEIPNNGIDDDQNGYIDDIRGWDFGYNDSNLTDVIGHGTICSGVAAAVGNNGIGVVGVAYNCKIMPVRNCDEKGSISCVTAVRGVRYAVDNGANICSMSWTLFPSFLLKDTIEYAYNEGVFLCAAAGNNNNCIKSYPAAYDHVVAVAATNQNDKRCSPDDWGQGEGSNYGDWVDIAAPGNLIYTTTPTYDFYFHDVDNASLYYEWARGTSFATPMVAGVAALLLSKDSSLTPDEVTAFLCGNVDPYNSTEYIGTGRLNAQKALLALSSDSKVTINGGLGIQAVITNQGPSDVTGIDWQIHVQGGILGLVNKTVSGTVDLKAGESQTVSLRPFFGLGNIVISVRVGDVGKAVRGIQLAIYSMVK